MVFLDEIGELEAGAQAKLLRVIEDRQVRRVGGLDSFPIDVVFVAATNRDLNAEVAATALPRGPVLSARWFQRHDPAAARAPRGDHPARALVHRRGRAPDEPAHAAGPRPTR